MLKGQKPQYRAVLLLMTVILLSSALLVFIFTNLHQEGNLFSTASALLLMITGAFFTSLLLCRFLVQPFSSPAQRGKQNITPEKRKQFADFMDDLPLGVFIKNNQSRAVYINKYMDKVFGESNCMGKTPYNIFDKKTAGRVMDEDRRALRGESVMVEEVITDKHGRERVFMTHKFRMLEENEEPQIGGISIEITRRREAEYKLRILSKAIRNSPVCVIITDPEGNIEYVNPAFVNSTGYSFAEVMGKNMSVINSGRHDESFFRDMWKRIKQGNDWQGEILNRKKDGTLFWELVSISSVVNREGNISHFVAIKDDISNRKQMEEVMRKAKEKAEDSDRLKSAFLANMSHEIRTPMNAIVGLSGLMSDPELPVTERQNFSEIIRENSNLLLQLIDDIVDISKIEAGQINIRPAICDIKSLMADIYESYKLQIKDREDNLRFLLNRDDSPERLYTFTDGQRLRQVIMNLISNALKFTEKGSVQFGCKLTETSEILFYVKDTGIGIPKDKLELIFDRFRQVEETEARNHRGAGLGLSISKSLVELLGGSIWAESEKGKGSCFSFTIPYQHVSASKERSSATYDSGIYPRLPGENILVVEDLEVNYRLIEAMLKKSGASIIRAKTGKDALEMISNGMNISLVLLDLNMPDIHGYDILVEIKKSRENLPVIIQTAYAMNGEKERCRKAGCDNYITKPIQVEQLISAVQECLPRKDRVIRDIQSGK